MEDLYVSELDLVQNNANHVDVIVWLLLKYIKHKMNTDSCVYVNKS